MQDKFEPIQNPDAVIALQNKDADGAIIHERMFRPRDLNEQACKALFLHNSQDRSQKWLVDGVKCELLEIGAAKWKKGTIRLRISLEFCSEELEIQPENSELDSLRQLVTE